MYDVKIYKSHILLMLIISYSTCSVFDMFISFNNIIICVDVLRKLRFNTTDITEVILTLTEVFALLFLSCKANTRVKLTKTGHGSHSSILVVICVVLFIVFV
jgi:hypothetical protein